MRRIALWVVPTVARVPYGFVAALVFVRFADEWFTFLPAGVVEPLRADLGLTYAQGGLILVALASGGFLGAALEVAADYVSRRVLASVGAATYGAAMIGFGLSDSFVGLMLAALVWGAASDAFVHGCEVALVDLAGEALPRVLARVNFWSAVGDLLAPASLAGALAVGLGWRSVFIGGGVLMLTYGGWLATLRFPPPRPPEEHANPALGMLAVLRDPRVWMLAMVDGMFAVLDEPVLGFLIAYLEQVRGFSPALAVALSLGTVAGGVIGYLIAERAVAGRRLPDVMLGAAAAMVASLPVMICAPGAPAILAGGAAFGVAAAIFYTALQAATLTLRTGQAGTTGAAIGVIGMAAVGFPALAGAVADTFGLRAALALYVAVTVLILALVAICRRVLP